MEIGELDDFDLSPGKVFTKSGKEYCSITLPNFSTRWGAAFVDFMCLFVLRAICMVPAAYLLINEKLANVATWANEQTRITGAQVPAVDFIERCNATGLSEGVLGCVIIMVLVGLCYHALMLASSKKATIGCMAMKLKLAGYQRGFVSVDINDITLGRACIRYIISIATLVMPMLAFGSVMIAGLNLFTIAALLFVMFWCEVSLFMKPKRGMNDILSRTILIKVGHDGKPLVSAAAYSSNLSGILSFSGLFGRRRGSRC